MIEALRHQTIPPPLWGGRTFEHEVREGSGGGPVLRRGPPPEISPACGFRNFDRPSAGAVFVFVCAVGLSS